jgi:retron-type reverse transcriptase
VSEHRGSARDFLARHKRHAKHVLLRGRQGLLEIAPHLLHRISDDRTLGLAWDYLAQHGGQAPGPDGLSYTDLDHRAKWQLIRALRDEIRSGDYSSGEEYLRWVPKRSRRGSRPLILQNIEDRVVQRATVEILQPLLDPRFDPRSFGFRPGRGTLDALACAERLALDEKRWVWVSVDIKDAFCHVALSRLLDIVRQNLVDEKLLLFIESLLKGAKLPGLRQGGPLSPLLLNAYLDHFLDRKWRKLHPLIPLIRYADDLLLLCRSRKEAVMAYAALVQLLRPTGMRLKEDLAKAVRRLDLGMEAVYMGFAIGRGQGRLRLGLNKAAWEALDENLMMAHQAPASPLRATQTIVGWLFQRAACFPDLGIDAVYARVQKVARQHAFDELLYPSEVQELAEDALRRWEGARKVARTEGRMQSA